MHLYVIGFRSSAAIEFIGSFVGISLNPVIIYINYFNSFK